MPIWTLLNDGTPRSDAGGIATGPDNHVELSQIVQPLADVIRVDIERLESLRLAEIDDLERRVPDLKEQLDALQRGRQGKGSQGAGRGAALLGPQRTNAA